MMNDTLDRIRRKGAGGPGILKHTMFDWPKNSFYPNDGNRFAAFL